VHPPKVVAGRRHTIELCYVVGPEPLAAGGHLLLVLPEYWGGIAQERDPTTFSLLESPGAPKGYISSHISADSSNPAVRVEGTVTCNGSVHTVVDVAVLDGALSEGDQLVFVIGDPRGQIPLTMEYAGVYRFYLAVDPAGTGEYCRLDPTPHLHVVGDHPSSVRVNVPATVPERDTLTVQCIPVDRSLNRAAGPAGELEMWLDGERLAEGARFGRSELPIPSRKSGLSHITIVDKQHGLGGRSGPCWFGSWAKEGNVYFGDIHTHTELSDGVGTLDDAFSFGRDLIGLDFVSMADHSEPDRQPGYYYRTDERWQLTIEATERFNEPGRFATLLGYEWGGPYDRNVYFRTSSGPCIHAHHPEVLREGSPQVELLWAALKDEQAFTVLHMTKFPGKLTWSHYDHDPQMERLIEVYSTWGSSEQCGRASVQEALRQGHRLGFICGTDNHVGRPGTGNRLYEGSGLAAVFAEELTREAVYDALYDRHYYGTTGARMLLDFRLNGNPMGSEITLDSDNERCLLVRVAGSAAIGWIQILRNNEIVFQAKGCDEYAELSWADQDTALDAYYYVRAEQADGHRCWSSPIWVDTMPR
jgi:hypothetical protein